MHNRAATFDDVRLERRSSRSWDVCRLKRVASRWELLGGLAVAFAWGGLVVWTAAGSESWQARICADLTHRPRSCDTLLTKKDESRIVPVTMTAGMAS